MNIAYVEYDFSRALNGMGPWSAVEDKEGMMWIPDDGRGNAVVRLDPEHRRADLVSARLRQEGWHPFGWCLASMAASGLYGILRLACIWAARSGHQADHR